MVQQSSVGRLQTCSGFLDTFPDVQLADDTFPPVYQPLNARGRADWGLSIGREPFCPVVVEDVCSNEFVRAEDDYCCHP